jgi:Mce-associated membrane protein
MTQVQPPPTTTHRLAIPHNRRKPLLIAAVVVVVLVAGIWGGTAWWHAHQAAQRAAADAAAGVVALRDGQQDINTMNTMDYRRLDACMKAWLSATTGTLHGQLSQSATDLETEFQAEELVTSGKITVAKVVQADSVAGTATMLGTEDLLVTLGTTQSTKHNGFRADLVRTAVGWRLNTFTTDAMQG